MVIHSTCWNIISNRCLCPLIAKVGITHDPESRWYGYFMDGYLYMCLLFRSDIAQECEELEKLIKYLRRRCARCTSPSRPTLANIIPGGEGSMRRFSGPHYVYMAIGSGSRLGHIRMARQRYARKKRKRDETTSTN